MKRFTVEDDFWSLFPDAKIGIVICKNIDNTLGEQETYEAMLGDAEKEALKYLQEPEFSDNEVIKVWREAFQKFKTKKGARSSIEALVNHPPL
jgi:DNA/RNA-binding domain of Phe-tRNA-synthetase-like protein